MGKYENRTLECSFSSMKTFMSCRRKYCLRYVEGLEPPTISRPMGMGKAVHKGIELLWSGRTPPETRIAIDECYTPDMRIEAGFDPDVAKTILVEFNARVPWKQWGITKAERKFRINMGYGLWLTGFIDATATAVDSRGAALIETKVLASVSDSYLNHLLWDDQATLYLYAARREGLDVRGIIYNLIQKPSIKPYLATPPEARKFTKDGKLYATQRERDETVEEYCAMIKTWYAEHPDAFRQHIVYRTDAQLDEIEKRVGMIAADIKAAYKDDSWYPNGGACAIMSCEYASLCLEDTPEARQIFNTTKTEVKQEGSEF